MRDSRAPNTIVLTKRDVRSLLEIDDCITVVEDAFRRHADGQTFAPGVLGAHVTGGGFHMKTAGLAGAAERAVFAAKVNANFPANPTRHALPTIQGVVLLFDATDGRPLAVMDSIEITSVRTAAATAVAARHLASANARTVTICGCGEQGRSQLRALTRVRTIGRVFAYDVDGARSVDYATEMTRELDIEITPVHTLDDATHQSDIWVTCTPARHWFLGRRHVRHGAFVAAVGADNQEKQEIDPALLAESTVVADVLDQCVTIGDLHHALELGVMQREDVHAELADIVSGRRRGREREDETIVFDSTGTALEDVATAKLVYERAVASGVGLGVRFGALDHVPNAAAGVAP
jgi:ornithine cyclodeaminase/alanine dehydrogenase-like protein (mu-crystallin family)